MWGVSRLVFCWFSFIMFSIRAVYVRVDNCFVFIFLHYVLHQGGVCEGWQLFCIYFPSLCSLSEWYMWGLVDAFCSYFPPFVLYQSGMCKGWTTVLSCSPPPLALNYVLYRSGICVGWQLFCLNFPSLCHISEQYMWELVDGICFDLTSSCRLSECYMWM